MHDGPVLIDGSPEGRSADATTHDIRLTLPADAQNVVLVRHVVTCLAQTLALRETLVHDIRLAVTEACTNVVRHAYAGGHGQLEVRIARDPPDALTVVVADNGSGPRPRVDADDEGPGLGLPLMGALAHELEFERGNGGGIRVRMRFLLGDG